MWGLVDEDGDDDDDEGESAPPLSVAAARRGGGCGRRLVDDDDEDEIFLDMACVGRCINSSIDRLVRWSTRSAKQVPNPTPNNPTWATAGIWTHPSFERT